MHLLRRRRRLRRHRTAAAIVDILAMPDRVKALGVRLGSARDAYRNAETAPVKVTRLQQLTSAVADL